MLDFKSILSIVFLLIISLCIVILKPGMHKQAIITDSQYEFVQISIPEKEIKPDVSNLNVSSVKSETKPVTTTTYNISSQRPITTTQPKPVQKPVQKISATNSAKPKQNNIQPKQIKQEQSKPSSQTYQPKQTAAPQPSKSPVTQPKTVKVTEETPVVHKEKPVLTEQEEIIVWNRWRSRIQNQVMMDTRVYAPIGTTFKFSFTVDKYGNMSNVKVWSKNSAYNDVAVKHIKPVLMSYRNQPILKFPEGTRRIITNVEGSFTISYTTEYSTPADFPDYERIKH